MIGIAEAHKKLGISRSRFVSLCFKNNIKIFYKFYTKQFIYISDYEKIVKIVEGKTFKKYRKRKDISTKEMKERIKKASEFKEKNGGASILLMKELN